MTTGPGGGNTADYPQSFLRIGTFDPHLEFTFSPPSVNRSSAGGAIVTGSSDLNFGAKYELGYSPRAACAAGAQFSVPTGSPEFTAGAAQYTGFFSWTYALGPVFGLAGTVSANASSGSNAAGVVQSYFAYVPSAVLSATMPNSSLFTEYAYFSRAGPRLGAKNLIDFGYSRDFGPNVQVDVEYGLSSIPLSGQRGRYVGAGLSLKTEVCRPG